MALLPWRDGLALTTVLLVFLLGVVASSLVGALAARGRGRGRRRAPRWTRFFTPPVGCTITQPENAFALVVFVLVGAVVASVVDRTHAAHGQAARGRAEADLLARG